MKKIFMAAITSALIFATGCSKKQMQSRLLFIQMLMMKQ